MLYCPLCRATYKEGTVRFCTNDNTRLVPAPTKEKPAEEQSPPGTFTNILGENLLFGEGEIAPPPPEKTTPPRKKRSRRKPLFAPSFEPPKGSRFFKSDEELESAPAVRGTGAESVELDLGDSPTPEPETSFKDVTLAGVVSSPDEPVAAERGAETEPRPAEDPMELVGAELKDRYRIVEKISQNETAAVYLARDKIALDKKVVATILIGADTGAEDASPAQTAADWQMLTKIKHPNIETVLDSGKLASGHEFFISEYLKCGALSAALEEEGRFDLLRTAQIVRQVSYALGELHRRGFIYQDLRPDNIVLCRSAAGTVQAKVLNPVISAAARSGTTNRDLSHLSPEQLENNPPAIASNTYTLGSIAYLLLTGDVPFAGRDAEELLAARRSGLQQLPSEVRTDLPAQTDEILKKALSLEPGDRYLQTRHFGETFFDALITVTIDDPEDVRTGPVDQTAGPAAAIPGAAEEETGPAAGEDVGEEIVLETGGGIPAVDDESPAVEPVRAESPETFEEETEPADTEPEAEEVFAADEDEEIIGLPEEETEISGTGAAAEAADADQELFDIGDAAEEEADLLETGAADIVRDVAAEAGPEQRDEIIELDIGKEPPAPEEAADDLTGLEDDLFDSVFDDREESAAGLSEEEEIIDLGQPEETSPAEAEIFPVTGQPAGEEFELDLGQPEEDVGQPDAAGDGELDLGGERTAGGREQEGMPLDSAIASVVSDLHLGDEEEELSAPTGQPAEAEDLPAIELNLDSLDERQSGAVDTAEEPAGEETLPAIEFDLDEIEHGAGAADIARETDAGDGPREPRIRIISPEKPYFESERPAPAVDRIGEEGKPDIPSEPVSAAVATAETTDEAAAAVEPAAVPDEEEFEKDYRWILLPLLLLLLLIAAITIFWYFGRQPQNEQGLLNTNTETNGPVAGLPGQTADDDRTDANLSTGDNAEAAADDRESAESAGADDFDFGAPSAGSADPRGGDGRGAGSPSGRRAAGRPKPPPAPRTRKRSPNKVRFTNTRRKTPPKLRKDFLGFTVDYPKDWKQNKADSTFLDISKDAPNGAPLKQFLITSYDSTGTFEGDRELFDELVEKSNEDLKKTTRAKYELLSEGETTIQDGRWRVYEVRFRLDGRYRQTSQRLTIWGRRLWVPIQRPGMKNGFVITMLATSFAPGVDGVEDVGSDDDLAEILDSFEPKLER